jgi:hypothetical protein
MFNMMCTKPACKKIGVMNLQAMSIDKTYFIVALPPPLIRFLAMEASMTTEFLNSTELIWGISSVIETWRGDRRSA